MIDFEKYKERFDTAQEQKESSSFRDKILEEFKKTEWNERKAELDKSLQSIKDEKDFEKYQKKLAKLFDDIFEIITAPGVDAFVNWLNNLTKNEKEVNATKLRNFLVDNYANYCESVDSIIENKKAFEIPDKSIFSNLLSEAQKAIKKDCNTFLDKPAEFENNIDGFLETLDENLSELADIEELAYTKVDELYSDEQKNNNIDFYIDIIEKIVEENQSLKPINDSEKDNSLLEKINKRIADTKKCIELLDNTAISTNQDETVQKLFLKYDNEMVDTKKGVVNTLEGFIDETWCEISDNYFRIKEYFENGAKFSINANDWDNNFAKKSSIIALIDNYNAIFNENPLVIILHYATKDIAGVLKKKAKAIGKHEESESELKRDISEVFETFTEEYELKIPLLESLSVNDNALSTKVQDIKDSIEGLKNGCESIENKSIITYLNEDFTSDLQTYNSITKWFTEVLQKSGMTEELNWLDTRLKAIDTGSISEADFDADVLKELLSKGLITLTITKTF